MSIAFHSNIEYNDFGIQKYGWILLICVALCFSIVARAEPEANIVASGSCGDDAYWSIDEEGNLRIWGRGTCSGGVSSWDIWEDYRSQIKNVVVAEGITELYLNFSGCQSLQSIELPKGITSIPSLIFSYCSNLSSINIPEGVTKIGDSAFFGCHSLLNIQLPSTLKEIGKYAFLGTNFTSITIPENVVRLGDGVFDSTYTLKEVYFLGDAPKADYLNGWYMQDLFTSSTTIYYHSEKSGWSTPLWHGYNCFPICERGHIDEYGNMLCQELLDSWKEYDKLTSSYHKTREYVKFICSHCKSEVTFPFEWEEEHEYDENGVCVCKYEKEKTCLLDELTIVDYLAFASLAYEDAPSRQITIANMLSKKWNSPWEETDIYYHELYDHIKDWSFLKHSANPNTGFYAMAFANSEDEVVIAYRGSNPGFWKVFFDDEDAVLDWIWNDLPAVFGSSAMGKSQLPDAFAFYRDIAGTRSNEKIAVAGHSLGGALADVVSAWSGCYGHTVNAISALDAAYIQWPLTMSETFTGVEDWAFIDIVNEYDNFAGAYDVELKPALIHESLHSSYLNGTLYGDHDIKELLFKDENGQIVLTKRLAYNQPTSMTWQSKGRIEVLQLGMSKRDDVFRKKFTANNNHIYFEDIYISYGGTGDDTIVTASLSDILIGGKGNDYLDGTWGNDTYIYNKGDGIDYIVDTAGKDKIYLQGFNKSDEILVLPAYDIHYSYQTEDNNGRPILITREAKQGAVHSVIMCNGEPIIYLDKNRGNNWQNQLILSVDGEERDITSEIQPTTVIKTVQHLEFSCPIDIDILNEGGNVVCTVKDSQLGNFYTDYGNFYVLPNEGSQYNRKILDLFEGYSVQIRGIANGSMNVFAQNTDSYALLDAYAANDIPVTSTMIATLEENSQTGDLYLAIDTNGDGSTDQMIPLTRVHQDENDHDNPMTLIPEKVPTCGANGQSAYYLCSCGKMFLDAAGQNEITNLNSIILPATGNHQYTNGLCTICGHKEPTIPQTGDATPLAALAVLLVFSAGMIILISRKRMSA